MPAAEAVPIVSVCICTYQRRSVEQTIDSVLLQEPSGPTFEIVVVDDDPVGFAREIVEAKARASTIPIRYVRSGASNIAFCRNTCLAEARGDWIAFIDDDEIAAPDWIAELLAARGQ